MKTSQCAILHPRLIAVVLYLATSVLLPFAKAHAQSGEIPLGPSDRIQISVGGIPTEEVVQLSKLYTVSDSGTINLLHIGEVKAAGVKPSELQRKIEQAYIAAEIYTNPTVTVSIDQANDPTSRLVYVVSGAERNGPVPFKQGLTLMQAIGAAGGPNAFARSGMRKVKLIRNRETTVHNLSKISDDPSVDVVLQPNDQIIIPE